jgi:hypothetical protein
MTENVSTVARVSPEMPARSGREVTAAGRYLGWLPTWGLITTRHLELRKRRVLMVVAAVLIVGPPVLVLGIRMLYHAIDPSHSGPAGSPGIFQALCDPLANFGFIMAVAIGATVGTSDLSDGMFRHLAITGRSRIALYLARIPAGLAVVLPLVALAYTIGCLVTNYAGTPQPTSIAVGPVSVPAHLSEAQLKSWILDHREQATNGFENGPGSVRIGPGPSTPGDVSPLIGPNLSNTYGSYLNDENESLNPAVNEMVKIGLWIELDVALGFMVGLGLGSLFGQRTVPIILLIMLQIIIIPALANTVIPYFLDGQRLLFGIALDQLRPAGLAGGGPGPGGGGGGIVGRAIFGGSGALGIPLMPTWAMISVITGWIVGWTGIGAWRMATRDA